MNGFLKFSKSFKPGAGESAHRPLGQASGPAGKPDSLLRDSERSIRFGNRLHPERAFSLLEIMVTVALLTVIVLGLYTIFDQTQRALRGNTTQVDVLESGRAAMGLMVRQIEQSAPANLTPNLSNGVNLYLNLDYPSLNSPNPIYQGLGTNLHALPRRTNVLQSVFLVLQQGNQWSATGFFVGPEPTTNSTLADGIGTLYQFIPTNAPLPRLDQTNLNQWVWDFERAKTTLTNAYPMIDGVIHLKLTAFDGAGWPLQYMFPIRDPAYRALHFSSNSPKRVALVYPTNNLALWQDRINGTEWYFLSNALPSYVELELGVLEPPVWARAKALPNTGANNLRRQFIEEKAGQVHLFRKRIPIRSSHS